jgi:two-component system, OmpR family, sensor histidine kinase VicK
MLIFPTNKAFGRQERIGLIGLVKQVARDKNLKVRMLVSVENLENSQEFVQEPFPLKDNYQQDPSSNINIRYIAERRSADLQETILIVDRNVSFVIELIDDTKASFEEAIGLATYSNSKSTALSYVSIFEILWKQTELYEQLKIHSKMQKEFIIVAAHELRNPIQPILGLSEVLLCRKGYIEEDKELLNVIIRNAKDYENLQEAYLMSQKLRVSR